MNDLDSFLPAIQDGDANAFALWLAGAELPLWRSLRRFASSVDTEAVTQEALLRVWQVAHRCESDGRPNSLLRLAIRIAHNLSISEIRRSGRRPPSGDDDGNREPVDPGVPPDPLLRRRIEECFGKLPRKPHAALLARICSAGGAPDAVLADTLEMRPNTFLQNIVRARSLLKDCLHRFGITVTA